MNRKRAMAARRAERAAASRPGARRPLWKSWAGAAAGAGAVLVLAGSFVVPGWVGGGSGPAARSATSMGVEPGAGLPVGSSVPSFSERDVETGRAITSSSLGSGRTLLFFSEGVMCQACFEQIKDLEELGPELERRGIELVSITPDPADDLRRAIADYGITTPMIADDDGSMSTAFNALGKGMHGNAPGHAFALLSRGKVVWYRDYWLPPTRSMYVEPEKLLAALPA